MKKQELNPYMLLETRCGEKMRFIKGYFITNELEILDQDTYTEDLIYAYNNERHDIVKVYEEDSEVVKWERKEFNWNDVPIGTKVIVRNFDNEEWRGGYFLKKDGKDFWVLREKNALMVTTYNQCKLEEEPVTVEELYNKFDEKCCEYSQGCGYCDYQKDLRYKNCKWAWLLDNYNVIRK